MLQRIRRGNRGFTLTELAIVLGVIGTILGAIWVAAGRVSASNKAQKAAAQVMQIAGNFRTLYAQHGVDVANGTDVTCVGANSNFFPTEMGGTSCVTGTTSTYPISPWGNGSYVQVTANQTNAGVVVAYFNLPQDGCNNLANAVTTNADVIWEEINTTSQNLPPLANNTPYTPSSVNAFCVAGSGNSVQVMFKAR